MIKLEEGRTRRLFTPEEEAVLEANWLTAETAADLLLMLPGRSLGTLIGHARLRGLPPRRFHANEFEPAPVAISEATFLRKVRALGGYPFLETIDGKSFMVWPFERAA